jgi:hypothetical protein
VIGVIFALVDWLFQRRLRIAIPLSNIEYSRYQRRRWAILKGALIAEIVGWGCTQLVDSIMVIGVLGMAAIGATPFLAGLLWYDRSQLIVVIKMQENHLWIMVRGNHKAFIRSLPAWTDRPSWVLPPADPPKRLFIAARLRAIPVRWQGAIMSGLGYYLSSASIGLALENTKNGTGSAMFVEHSLIIGTVCLQLGLLLLAGGQPLYRLLFKSPDRPTSLGILVAVTSVFFSFSLMLWLRLTIRH